MHGKNANFLNFCFSFVNTYFFPCRHIFDCDNSHIHFHKIISYFFFPLNTRSWGQVPPEAFFNPSMQEKRRKVKSLNQRRRRRDLSGSCSACWCCSIAGIFFLSFSPSVWAELERKEVWTWPRAQDPLNLTCPAYLFALVMGKRKKERKKLLTVRTKRWEASNFFSLGFQILVTSRWKEEARVDGEHAT